MIVGPELVTVNVAVLLVTLFPLPSVITHQYWYPLLALVTCEAVKVYVFVVAQDAVDFAQDPEELVR